MEKKIVEIIMRMKINYIYILPSSDYLKAM